MTVQELIERLSQMSPDAEVRIAHQPSYPFELSIREVVEVDLSDEDKDEEKPIVYIAEGSQLGYLPGAVSEELGWR